MSTTDIIENSQSDEEAESFSEDFDSEVEFQPSKRKEKNNHFDSDFQFFSTTAEYNRDTWNDLSKYIKRKAKTKTDDKIKRIRATQPQIDEVKSQEEPESYDLISDDELKHDNIKLKQKKQKKAQELDEDDFFEDANINTENASFYQMNLSRPLMKAIGEMNFVHPTPIQASTIPVALLGRDICGCAATGTGKTAAYMLPTLERLLYRPVGPSVTRVLVLVPTRELGVQVYQVSKQLSQFTDIQMGLAVGGLDVKAQEAVLRKNPDIVIATPGRLIDHLKSTPTFGLDSIEILILDEADRILDEYFAEQMKEIIKQCSRTRQTMLFSATMTEEVENLAAISLVKPQKIFVDSNKDVASNLRQEFIRIRSHRETDRETILAALVCRSFREHCMIFVQTKKQAHRIHILLGLLGLKVGELHGNLTQPQRLDALEKFKNKEYDILVATDVAARGLDIFGVKTVINFTMPATHEHYIHRVGRTARAGRGGISVSLAGERERKIVKEVVKRARNPVRNRIIPPDILEKYKTKLEKLESQIDQILQEEHAERLLSKAENQANRVENALNNKKEEERPWFQTKKERRQEKEKLSLKGTSLPDNVKSKGKGNKKSRNPQEDRINNELNYLSLVQARQARLAKKKQKPKKIYAVTEDTTGQKKGGIKRKKSNFDDSLWDVSQKNAKKLRFVAKQHQKEKQQQKGRQQKGKQQKSKQKNVKKQKGKRG